MWFGYMEADVVSVCIRQISAKQVDPGPRVLDFAVVQLSFGGSVWFVKLDRQVSMELPHPFRTSNVYWCGGAAVFAGWFICRSY